MQPDPAKIRYAILLFATFLGSTFAFLPNPVFAATIGCGSTIIVSTTLSDDIGPCAHNGIMIGASGVVLNCAGHTISGTSVDKGISLVGVTKVTVENCNVTGFKFGFFLRGGSGNTLSGNTAGSNAYGFYLKASNSNTLTGNTASGNSNEGFLLYRSGNNVVSGNTADSNGNGFYHSYGSGTNTLSGNTADSNTHYGYYDLHPHRTTYQNDECSNNLLGGSSPTGLCTPQP